LNYLLVVLSGGFGLGAIVCAIQVILIRANRFPRNPYLGLQGYSRESDVTWTRAHEAAAPWIFRAGITAAAASVLAGIGLAFRVDFETSDTLSIMSGLVGAVAAGLYLLGGHDAAARATRRR